ncbi:MAG: DUF4249 domain-containing protein [Bacteroidota bacterium]
MKNISLLVLLAPFLFACEQVIDVDLNESDPQVVIEARLEAGQHDFEVLISETTSYFSNETAVYRNDAQVRLLDNVGGMIEVPLESNGLYRTSVNAISGQTYTLEVSLNDKTYMASAEVPQEVVLDELEAEFREAFGPFDEGYQVFLRFADNGERRNYYRQIHAIDGVFELAGEDLQVTDDNLFDGSERARLPIFQRIFDPGVSITVVLQHIDKNSFDYLNSLADIIGEDGGPNGGSAAPGNPTTNWDGDILGYFGAIATDTLQIDLPE